jgi:hypothetical protein
LYRKEGTIESPVQTQGTGVYSMKLADARRKMSRTRANAQYLLSALSSPLFKVKLYITTDTGDEEAPGKKPRVPTPLSS